MKSALSSRLSALRDKLSSCFWFAIFASAFLAVPCSADVLRIAVNDAIQPVTAEYIARALAIAADHHDQAVLIEMNTPGGLFSSTREIIEMITSSPFPGIVYFTPSCGHACSAGIFIL